MKLAKVLPIVIALVLTACLLAGCDATSWPAKSIIHPSKSAQDQKLEEKPYDTADVDICITPTTQPAPAVDAAPRIVQGHGGIVNMGDVATSQPAAAITIQTPDGKTINAPAGSKVEVGRRWNSYQNHTWNMTNDVGGMRTTQDLKGSEIASATTSMPPMNALATRAASTQPSPAGSAGTPVNKVTTETPDNPLENALTSGGVSHTSLVCYVLGGLCIVGGIAAWWFLRAMPYASKIGGGLIAVGVGLIVTGYLIHHWIIGLIVLAVLLAAVGLIFWYSAKKHQSVGTTATNLVAAVERLPVAAREEVTTLIGKQAKDTGSESTVRQTVTALKTTDTVGHVLQDQNKKAT